MNLEDDISEFIEREYAGVVNFPNLQYYITKYAKPCDGNDIKAIKLFRYYEGLERVRAVQREFFLIKSGGAAQFALTKLCGLKRKGSYGTYEKWAQTMLLHLSAPSDGF